MTSKTARSYRPLLWVAALLLLAGGAALSGGALLRGPLVAVLSRRLQRTVQIDRMQLSLVDWRPQAQFTGFWIGEPAWAGGANMLDVPRARVQIDWTSLFGGPLRTPLIEMDNPVLRLKVDPSGRANWRFGPVQADPKPFQLFFIQRLTIRSGRIEMDDRRRKLVFSGLIATEGEARGATDKTVGGGALTIAATGRIEDRPFRIDLKGAPISNLVAGRPYSASLQARDGPTTLDAKVALATAFDLGHYSGQIKASGPDLSALHALTGAVLPNTPPYDLSGHIQRDLTRYQFTDVTGRVGQSDLSGDVRIDKIAGRRKVVAQLASRHLLLADLTAVIGAKRGRGAPLGQAKAKPAASTSGSTSLLPTAPLYVARLRSLDAQLRYKAASVTSPRLPLRKLDLGLDLQAGVLMIQPLTFQFAHGVLSGRLRLDARGATPATDLNVHLSGFRLEDLLHPRGGAPIRAPLNGYADLHGRGLSVRQTAGDLSGRAALIIAPGRIRRQFAELIGGAGLSLDRLLTPAPSETALRCGLIGLNGRDGRFVLNPAVIDTGVATLRGGGDIDLGAERLDVRIVGFSKRPDVLRVFAPITVSGPLTRPKIAVDPVKIAAQTATGVLTTLLSPLASVLPPLKGQAAAPDVDCTALLAGRR